MLTIFAKTETVVLETSLAVGLYTTLRFPSAFKSLAEGEETAAPHRLAWNQKTCNSKISTSWGENAGEISNFVMNFKKILQKG